MAGHQTSLARLGVHTPRILLPRSGTDLTRWAVIACDQHTSEPDYWAEVERIVADHPSTLHLIYPEVYLEEPDSAKRIEAIHKTMRAYLEDDVLEDIGETMILTRRSTPYADDRRGLVLALDLEHYDYRPGATSLIRATEQTIAERLPPRVRIREGAPLELPHVLVLVDDPDDELFGELCGRSLPTLYRTELMLGGGRISGHRLDEPSIGHVARTLERLLDRSDPAARFLFAVGDGNHSLATAKEVWETLKAGVRPDHPARYALVEIVNLYDPGLRFEPIHRLVRGPDPSASIRAFAAAVGGTAERCPADEVPARLAARLAAQLATQTSGATEPTGRGTAVGYVSRETSGIITISGAPELPVAIVQSYLDTRSDLDVDYIHGWDACEKLGLQAGSFAIVLPEFDARLLYPTVTSHGVLPRKAFSLGEASEKRYYLEARRIL